MNHSSQSRAARWLWAGAFRALGFASVLLGGSAFAQECAAPAACTPAAPCGPSCQDCQRIFDEAACKLKNLNPGGCAPTSCAPGADACTPACGPDCNQCQRVFEEAANRLNNCHIGCAPAPACAAPATSCGVGCGVGCGSGCGGKHGGWLDGDLGEAWTIGGGATNGWQAGGWTAFGYSNNPDGAFTGNGVFLDDRYEWDRVNLNQQGIYFGKVATTTDCNPIAFGGRAEFVYGVDGNEFQSFGNNPGEFDFLNGYDHGIYEWAIPQLYAEVAVGDHSIKAGHFYTLLGYEVLPTAGNFFFSKQLTFYNSEPFTHTGVLVASKLSDKLTVHNGWVLGMDTGFDQLNGGNAYHGGFIYNHNECTSITDMMVFGDLGWRGNGFINSFIITHKWTDKLQSVHQFDVLATDLEIAKPLGPIGLIQADVPADFAVDGIARDSIGQINYLFYDFNPRFRAGVRQEWYKADSVSYYTVTYGVNVKPMANLVIRPEVRHMWSPGNDIQYPNSAGGTEDLFNQTVFGVDAVLTY